MLLFLDYNQIKMKIARQGGKMMRRYGGVGWVILLNMNKF